MSRWDAHLSTLIDGRYPALVAYARMLTGGDIAAAEDLVQDAVIKSFARSRAFSDVHHAENYVRKAIVTTFVDSHRRRSRTVKAYSRSVEPSAVPGHEAAVASAADVAVALAGLPARERACVVLRFYDDLTVPEVAARLGLAEGTVKRYLSDASVQLALALGTHADNRETVPVTSHR